MNRRRFLRTGASVLALAGAALPFPVRAQEAQPTPSAPKDGPFSFDLLTEKMRQKAKTPYDRGASTLPKSMQDFTVDEYRAIRYKPDHALWRSSNGRYELQAFHPGWLFDYPVHLFEVVDGRSHPVTFTSADFDYRPPLDASHFEGFALPGVGGFRLHYPLNRPDYRDELITFLGNSYFRALGRNSVYGLSARGIALNTASDTEEEFPDFTAFYLERPTEQTRTMRVWAALEGPSLTGAYAFEITPGADTVVDVTARLFFRNDVERLGVAPLTSMFFHGENENRGFDDVRPEVHDSDGLVIVNGDGEEIFRPVRNPSSLRVSFFSVANPRRFGLCQRDRDFWNYQDVNAHFGRRPSVWIHPRNDWGPGRVVLAEIPSNSESNDNIVSFWQPEEGPTAGSEREYSYRMLWGSMAESANDLARVKQTRTGYSGNLASKPNPEKRRFVIDFEGGMLPNLSNDSRPTATVEAGGGRVVSAVVQPIPKSDCWRIVIEARRDGDAPVELRAFLKFNDERLSETWLYQWSS